MRCNESKNMYCVSLSRTAGRILSLTALLTASSLMTACSTDLGRFNQPASFGLSDNNTTASLPVPPEPLYGNQRRTPAPAPAPDYSNRQAPSYGSQGNSYGQGYGRNSGRDYGARQNGGQGRYGSNQGYYGNRTYGSNRNYNPPQPYGSNQGYGANRNYGGQSSTRVARLPDPNPARGPLPPRNTIPQNTYNQPEKSAVVAQPQARKRSAVESARGRVIEVQQGQTLYGIARAHGVKVADLKTLNGLSGDQLKLGQKLTIPPTATQIRSGYAAPASAPRTTVRKVQTQPVIRNKATGRTYRVARGDSLYGIASRHGMTSADLARFNGMSQSTTIKPGQTLSIPADARQARATSNDKTRLARRDTPAAAPKISARPDKPAQSIGKFRWPVEGRIISRFGSKNNGAHNDGVNLAVPAGTSVRAAEKGVVAYAGNELKGYGNLILVRHSNDWVSAYAHVDSMLVKRGDKISRGQVIAKSGKTGNVDRPQVHFELRKNSKPVNPLTHLASR